jgi:hypothetical protein
MEKIVCFEVLQSWAPGTVEDFLHEKRVEQYTDVTKLTYTYVPFLTGISNPTS